MRREGLGQLWQLPDDVSAADWIVAAVRTFDHTVGSLVPPVFEAYARVFHPAARRDDFGRDVSVSWAEVAAANGRQAHAGMEWVAVTGSWEYHHGQTQSEVWDLEPVEGSLPAAQAAALVPVLARSTGTPDDCLYAVWEGFGALGLAGVAKTVAMPSREMLLFTGPLSQAAQVSMEEGPREQSPSLWWPADRAWCVATDVDLMTTYVGGSRACIDAVLAAPGLEAWDVDHRQRVTWDSDTLNPQPQRPE
ncbi:hypothetical protein [Kineococcus rubinsiae]|uniref:hypothetical protein n=1 Tax=Kineococcus rubinsiae TaxID=2609562 RepID=UPI00142F8C83|nr:hypothetical protein [Kineococcus rubinsiae]NIZ91358.1 hypothetical protein [Kineococcus rubinsiae]